MRRRPVLLKHNFFTLNKKRKRNEINEPFIKRSCIRNIFSPFITMVGHIYHRRMIRNLYRGSRPNKSIIIEEKHLITQKKPHYKFYDSLNNMYYHDSYNIPYKGIFYNNFSNLSYNFHYNTYKNPQINYFINNNNNNLNSNKYSHFTPHSDYIICCFLAQKYFAEGNIPICKILDYLQINKSELLSYELRICQILKYELEIEKEEFEWMCGYR